MWWWVWRHFVSYKEIFWFGILNKRAWLFSGASWVIFITLSPTPDRQFHKHLTWDVRLYQPLGRPSAKWIQRSVQKGAEIQGTKVRIHIDEQAHPPTHTHTYTYTYSSEIPPESQSYNFFKSCDEKKLIVSPTAMGMPAGKAASVRFELEPPCRVGNSWWLWGLKWGRNRTPPQEGSPWDQKPGL